MNRVAVAIIFALMWMASGCAGSSAGVTGNPTSADSDIERAFKTRASNVEVQGEGTVERILEDDLSGSRHQRFIVRVDSGQTVLITHNIDLAPRVEALHEGDSISFYGEYVWSAQGGTIHWTHHDPQGKHVAGWLKYKGQTYQ